MFKILKIKVLRILVLVSLLLLGLAAAQDPNLDLPCHPSLIKKAETKTSSEPNPKPTPLPGQDPLDTPIGPPEKPVVVLPIDPPQPEEDPKDEPVYFFGEELRSETSSVVFVIDISGSMQQSAYTIENGYRNPPKIVPAKRELRSAIRALPKHWTFDIVAYDDNTFLWRPEMVLATDEAKTSAETWVEALQPFGATGTGPAVSLALALSRDNQYLVLLTDGAPNVPSADPNWHRTVIRDNNFQGAVIDVFAIEANTAAMRGFCSGVAIDNDGRYVDVK